jgi:hypothetical protein
VLNNPCNLKVQSPDPNGSTFVLDMGVNSHQTGSERSRGWTRSRRGGASCGGC